MPLLGFLKGRQDPIGFPSFTLLGCWLESPVGSLRTEWRIALAIYPGGGARFVFFPRRVALPLLWLSQHPVTNDTGPASLPSLTDCWTLDLGRCNVPSASPPGRHLSLPHFPANMKSEANTRLCVLTPKSRQHCFPGSAQETPGKPYTQASPSALPAVKQEIPFTGRVQTLLPKAYGWI